MHLIFFFFLLGLGAAAPIGPVNIEIIRRNLHLGFLSGLFFGAGACLADLTYLCLLITGWLVFLNDPTILRIIGILGSLVIAWFGYKTFKSKSHFKDKEVKPARLSKQLAGGYLMTILNPITILFWVSVSAQVASFSTNDHALWLGGIGVILGAFGWALFLNVSLHFSRKMITPFFMRVINYLSGMILIGIAAFGLMHALS